MNKEKKRLVKREEDYNEWYLSVIESAEMADYSPVKGCMVIRPWGYAIWEKIQNYLDKEFKAIGVKNAYFPIFIPQSFLTKEAEHVEGFAPECATVTEAGGKKLEEPLVVRPTSETIMYAMYAKWIKSYRDLPLLINQWANVVRWEMRTRLFLRTTEFLWQEGHTAHSSEKEADDFSLKMLAVYQKFVEEIMSISVVSGVKSEAEKFAGAVKTYSIEAMMQDGKALQAGTSHFLGQNFSQAFDVKYLSKDNIEEYVWQTSWGVSTRLIGALIMAHSDDKGLVLPPKLAPIQVVIIPVLSKEKDNNNLVNNKAKEISKELSEVGILTEIDFRDNLRIGEKIFEWEKKGVPLRIEIGLKELEKNEVLVSRRDLEEKEFFAFNNNLSNEILNLLNKIQNKLLENSKVFREKNTYQIEDYNNFKELLEKQSGFYLTHWCGDKECERKIKEETKATIRCIPFDIEYKSNKNNQSCLYCKKDSKYKVILAKSY